MLPSSVYRRLGNPQDIHIQPTAGIAMMGGGRDLDEAFRWLCGRGNGGDFLVLRATGDDAYNAYINGLCKTNSVATLILPDRQAALDPAAAKIIRKAAVVFIAGGDQANYIRGWRGTPVERAINAHIAAASPSGGRAPDWRCWRVRFGCLNDKADDADLASTDVLPNPYFYRVTLVKRFLRIPHLENLLTDSHFAKRDRMGRSLVFLARIIQDDWSQTPREVAIDEGSAALVEQDGSATIVGRGNAPTSCVPLKSPRWSSPACRLTFNNVSVYRVPSGGHFDLISWTGSAVRPIHCRWSGGKSRVLRREARSTSFLGLGSVQQEMTWHFAARPRRRGGIECAGSALARSADTPGIEPKQQFRTADTPVLVAAGNAYAYLETGYQLLRRGEDTLEAAITVVRGPEDDPNEDSVGLGGLPNEDGVVELDASCMHGPSRRAGAVGGRSQYQKRLIIGA